MTPQLPAMTPPQFIAKWRDVEFGEKQASQEMFLDICALIGHPTPVAYGSPDAFTFEKWVPGGFADAYLEDRFGWEFKGSDDQLPGAFNQLLRYQVYLKTPPLLIVSSFRRIQIRTNFPGMETVLHEIPIVELDQEGQRARLRNCFFAPDEFRPDRSVEDVTRETAELFRDIVADMERHTDDPERLARYLNRIVLCLYAEDAGLLPENVLADILTANRQRPDLSNRAIANLFEQMAGGGLFGPHEIAHFNGDLFRPDEPVELSPNAVQRLGEAVSKNWRNIEPSIFGTLFERALDASQRARLGAHYTSADDIMLVINPVVMDPLEREWDAARQEIEELLEGPGSSEAGLSGLRNLPDYSPQSRQSENLENPDSDNPTDRALARLLQFQERLAGVTVLDPACGSGNFLYLALRGLLDLEKRVIDFAAAQDWHGLSPTVKPNQMRGLEINPYAAELARTALWIGYIQWHQANGFPYIQSPILTPLDTIRQTDAILDLSDPDNPTEPEWPAAEFIVGNPPFLGHFPFRESLGDEYVNAVYGLYGNRIPNSSDLCCYWFEKARGQIESGATQRAGLLATQAIRFQSNRRALARIKETGDIFAAISDKDWVLDGATVHTSIICFDDGSETARSLDGRDVVKINADLTAGADVTKAKALPENSGISFMGDIKVGPFEITADVADEVLRQRNPHGKPNSDVVKRWMIGRDINQRPRDMWIIDFGIDMSESDAALYEAPFEYVLANVKPLRDKNRDQRFRNYWWLHGRPRIEMRQALTGMEHYIGTSMVSRHRMFAWIDGDVLPDATIIVFARDDDYFFGVLQSRIHTLWASAMGTQLREAESGLRYTPTTCFETFPFPEPTGQQREAIALAAAELNRLRENDTRTLTNLYNARPTWLDNAHAVLDAAVADAYGWPADLGDEEILERILALNLERAGETTRSRPTETVQRSDDVETKVEGMLEYRQMVSRMRQEIELLTEEHPNQWVAMAPDGGLFVASTMEELLAELDKRGLRDVNVVIEFLDYNIATLTP